MQFSILQWNVWYKEPVQHIATFLKDHPADVVCLQELTIDHPEQSIANTPAYVAKELGFRYFHKEIPIESTDGSRIMLANGIFSRFPIAKKRAVFINQPRTGGGYDDEYRAYVEVTLKINGGELSVGTIHMSYTHAFEPTPNKRAETGRLLTELQKHSSHFIFAGDLNAAPGSYTVEKISALMQNVAPNPAQKTWTTKPFSYNGFEETGLNWRLDHIFATPDIKLISSEILQTDYSDHLPIRSILEIKT
jgi:endonuclease/exonuclease/phosphatase family metal-dependent hydrolase